MREQLREASKSVARGVAAVITLPIVVSFAIRRVLLGADRALQGSTQALASIPGLPGQYIRRAFLQCALDHCHKTAVVEYGTTFSRAGARLTRNVIGPACDWARS
jgi:hypothetical protein